MNLENFQGSPGRTWTDMIIMGVKDKLGVFMKNKKKFKQCFERRSECVLLTT